MHRTALRPGRRSIAVVAAIVATGILITAAPAVVAEPQVTIAEVQAQIEQLQTDAEMAAENLNGAQVRLERVQARQVATREKARRARAALAGQARNLGQMASVAYRSGGIDASVQLLMADNPADFLQESAALDIVAKSQNAVLRRTAGARIELAQAEIALAQQESEATAIEKEMADNKAAIEANLAEQERVLSQLKEEERRRLEAEARAREAAATRAAAAAVAAAQAAAAEARARADAAANNNDTTGSYGSSGDTGTSDTGGPGDSGDLNSGGGTDSSGQNDGFVGSDQASIAVAAALAQVGEPYTYDARPPDTWDCSKLTAWAWGQAGVSLTAYSYDQANEVRRISTDELQPGDLLFYFNGAHHVSMYIGGGQIVEAANPSSGVRLADAWNGWNSSHFSFAGRPVG